MQRGLFFADVSHCYMLSCTSRTILTSPLAEICLEVAQGRGLEDEHDGDGLGACAHQTQDVRVASAMSAPGRAKSDGIVLKVQAQLEAGYLAIRDNIYLPWPS